MNGKIGRTKFVTQSSSQQEFVRTALDPASNQQPDFFTLKSLAAMLMLQTTRIYGSAVRALPLYCQIILPVKTPTKP